MNHSLLRRIEAVFIAVADLEPAARAAEIKRLCADDPSLAQSVEAMLAESDHGAGPLDSGAPALAGFDEPATADEPLPAGKMVGQYRIVSVLGMGGMGVVYLAEQSRPSRTVALKVIRPGFATAAVLRRFEFEAEVLGKLQHPGIAQIIEAGTADAGLGVQPFFAMELVRGSMLTDYAAGNALDTRGRVELLIKVCDAVEHAHQRGVIHRDLKPANVLVDAQGQPKILDFGVARAAEGQDAQSLLRTTERTLVGTLPYMSPEQVSGDGRLIDTRCDVYALGVVLFELLAGHLPHDIGTRSFADAVRMIQDVEPQRLASANSVFRGDLDTIVCKALERDRNRRYQSAAALREDLRRYLRNEPILARPPSAVYHFRKFASRRKGVVAAGTLAMVFLVGGLVSSTLAWQKAGRERAAALASAARARESLEFLKSVLLGIDPDTARNQDSALLRDILARTQARLQSELPDQPEARAQMHAVIGEAYRLIGRTPESLEEYSKAIELIGENASTPFAADVWRLLGSVRRISGDAPGAAQAVTRSLEIHRALGTLSTTDGLKARVEEANNFRNTNELQRADALLPAIIAEVERLDPPQTMLLVQAVQSAGLIRSDLGDHAGAVEFLRRAEELCLNTSGMSELRVARIRASIADDLFEQGKMQEAADVKAAALATLRRALTDNHPETANCKTNLALTLIQLDRLDEARVLLEESTLALRDTGHNRSPMYASALTTLAAIYLLREDAAAARPVLTAALPVFDATTGDNSVFSIDVLTNLAHCGVIEGNYAAALESIDQALARARRCERDDLPWRLQMREMRCRALVGLAQTQPGRVAEAREALESARRDAMTIAPDHWVAIECEGQLGLLLAMEASALEPGRREEALLMFPRALELCRRSAEAFVLEREDTAPALRMRRAVKAWNRMADVLERWNRLAPDPTRAADAARWRQRAQRGA